MAVRDHSLDRKIEEAATAEFMEHGFRSASLRKIAARAGITTGALYTRYKNKDVLFTTLVESALQEVGRGLEPIHEQYLQALESRDPDRILAVIRREEEIYLHILFEYYEPCILFFCRSDGSAVQKKLQQMMEQKAKKTVACFRSIARQEVELDGVELILAEQFHYYRRVLEQGMTREKAVSSMKTVETFLEAGWRDLFRRML